jgi:prepilin-type N-terminal cleavage/methylation domain-containing protein
MSLLGNMRRMARPGLGWPGAGGRRGLTLVEVVVATSVVALLASAAGGAAHVILSSDREAQENWEATELALALLQEVASLPFNDPQVMGTTLGPDGTEWDSPGLRGEFDDVDDYAVWDGSYPLQQKDGTAITMPGYTRRVVINYVDADDFSSVSALPTDYKRITVDIFLNGAKLRSIATVRVEGGRNVDFDG